MIRFALHAQIDKPAWDQRLARCTNKLWYGLSSTLDAAAPGWDALIDEEADTQLALPWRKKFGIAYAYQPFLLQQLGPFAASPSPQDPDRFMAQLPTNIRFADVYLCPGNAAPPVFTEQQNILLDLRSGIDDLRKRYSENHRRNLRKTEVAATGWDERVPLDELIAFFRNSEQFIRWKIDAFRMEAMERILRSTSERSEGFTCGVRNGNQLVAGAYFVRWGGRLIFLKGLASRKGRELHAMHYLIDRVIAEHAGNDLLLDFAGTNDTDLARFYLGFGSERSLYLRALVNRLPPLLRTLKT